MRILTVLRTGGKGEFTPAHVRALAAQVKRHAFPYELEVLTDVDVPGVECIPLEHRWPGWWSKMELFRLKGNILFFDLDTVIIGSLQNILAVDRLTMLRDFSRDGSYKGRAEGLGSGMMFLPESERAGVWGTWIADPAKHMREAEHRGDQAFLESLWLDRAARWQDLVPGQIVSYKAHCNPQWKTGGKAAVPPEARIVVFHGKPRPWAAPEFQHLYRAA